LSAVATSAATVHLSPMADAQSLAGDAAHLERYVRSSTTGQNLQIFLTDNYILAT
jgi:hypothetical protein